MHRSAADARLDALDAAAVGLLEPLIGAADEMAVVVPVGLSGAAEAPATAQAAPAGWRPGLADALDRLAEAALALELVGLSHVVGLLRAYLLGAARIEDAALELASAEGWVSDAIAFCGGQLGPDESAGLIERLRDWPGLSECVTEDLAGSITAQLRQDARRLAAATLADLVPGEPVHVAAPRASAAAPQAPVAAAGSDEAAHRLPGRDAEPATLAVGADELAMLAEAAGQLDEEFAGLLDDDDHVAEPATGATRSTDAAMAESLELGADAVERYASAVGYVGLAPVAAALATLSRNLLVLACDLARFEARHRALLRRLAPAWSRLFHEPSAANAGEALALLADPAWPVPAEDRLLEASRRAFGALTTVATRRVAAAGRPIDERELSLEIPADADRNVVDNLLHELPALSNQFSACIERVRDGSAEAIAAAQRIAHTLKGSANTVGVRGIASLTHQLEDLLQLLEGIDGDLAEDLVDLLADAADCLAEMSEAVAGLGPAPATALETLRRVRDWTDRLLEDPAAALAVAGGGSVVATSGAGHAAPVVDDEFTAAPMGSQPTESPAPAAPLVATTEPAEAAAEAGSLPHAGPPSDDEAGATIPAAEAAQDWLRVPASLIERLLGFADEASILLSQAQEQALEADRVRATLRAGTDQLQDLAGELERLVDVRGLALSERRDRGDFDALELDEYDDLHMVSRRIAESGADGRLVEQQLGGNVAALRDSLSRLERIQVDLREAALQTRTVRVETVVPRWRRTVRQAARMSGHEANLRIDGEATEIDAPLLQALVEPIAHLLRNAVDHGIEAGDRRRVLGKPAAGSIVLGFAREGPDLLVTCSDDGRGLDLTAIRGRAVALGLLDADEAADDATLAQLVLAPGFSTRASATQLSGRGIGLDVVNQAVREQRGSLDIETTPGQGTRIRLRLPVRLAAVPVIVVRSASHVLALSVRDVETILGADCIETDEAGVPRCRGAESTMRLVRIEDALGLPDDAFAPPAGVEPGAPALLQVRTPGGERVAVRVPEPGQTRNVIVRPLAPFLPRIAGIEGAAVLGDGAVAPVVDLPQLLAARHGARAMPPPALERRAAPVCLIVDDSVSVRRSMELFARDLGYEVDSASDGVDALEHVARRVPSLALVDLEMPRMNGVELVRALRERPATHAVPVVMITSRSSDKHRRLALEAGVDVFLTKPYTEDDLAQHMARLAPPR
jgi:chemotaxis protein histidine kinase CheA